MLFIQDVSDEEEKSSGDDRWGPRKMTIQPQRNLGLPPSDSEEEESSDEEGGPSNSRPQEEIRIRVSVHVYIYVYIAYAYMAYIHTQSCPHILCPVS